MVFGIDQSKRLVIEMIGIAVINNDAGEMSARLCCIDQLLEFEFSDLTFISDGECRAKTPSLFVPGNDARIDVLVVEQGRYPQVVCKMIPGVHGMGIGLAAAETGKVGAHEKICNERIVDILSQRNDR